MKLGASQWPFKWDPPYDEVFSMLDRLGLRSVEFVAWDRHMLKSYYTPETIAQLRSTAGDLNIEISEFVGTSDDLAHPDPARREEAIEHFAEIVDVATQLGTSIVNSLAPYPFAIESPWLTELRALQVWEVPYPRGLDWRENWNDYVEAVKRCCAMCEDAGLRWAIEPHPHRHVANVGTMLRLIDHVGSDVLGVNVDPSHLFPVGETPHAAVYQFGDRVFNCHISDNDGSTNAHFRPGTGKIDWRAFLQALADVGFDGSISLELEDAPGVSRGVDAHPGARALGHRPVGDERFMTENRLAAEFLGSIAESEGIILDGAPQGA